MSGYEFLDHTADVLVKAFGNSLEEAFGAAADAMFAVITDSAPIRPLQPVELEIESIDREGLLVAFLSQLIVVFETDGLVLTDFNIAFLSDRALKVAARGEPFNQEIHGQGTQVKGVSYHMMEITEPRHGQPATVRVLFDI